MRRFMIYAALPALCLAVALTAQAATTYYVDFTTAQFVPPDDRDGSEDTPFLTIADAMGVVVSGDTVIVKPERYTENVELVSGVELRAEHPATDADTGLDDITQIVPADPALPAVVISDDGDADTAERTAVIGFQILDGAAEIGAGIRVDGEQAWIEKNVFVFNEAMGLAPFGGGFAIVGASELSAGQDHHAVIIANAFAFNTALGFGGDGGRGGAGACRPRAQSGTTEPTVPRILLQENKFGSPENLADWGGGIYAAGCEVSLVNNRFSGNMASFSGGGLACDAALCAVNGSAGGSFNVFEGNLAGAGGGGVFMNNPLPGSRIDFGAFRSNDGDGDSDESGNGGAILVMSDSSAAGTLMMTGRLDAGTGVMFDNRAVSGGGLAVEGPHARVVMFGYRLIANEARRGGGIFVGPEATVLLGTDREPDSLPAFLPLALLAGTMQGANVLAENAASDQGGGLYAADSARLSVLGNLFGNLVEDSGSIVPAEGNTTALGDGGGLWIDGAASATVMLNCVVDNTAGAGGSGLAGGGPDQQILANSLYKNRADTNGGTALLFADADFALNEVRENTEGGVTCLDSPAGIRSNVIQGNDPPFDLDIGQCGSGDGNDTGDVSPVSGFAGAAALFPDCGPIMDSETAAPMPGGDYGDAPDTTGGAFSAGYRGDFADVPGKFPTYFESDHAAADRRGPVHVLASLLWLGPFTAEGQASVSNDRGAESPFDDDGMPNLDRVTLSADLDAFDDGWQPRRLEACSEETLDIQVSADVMLERFRVDSRTAYLNIAADWNHDGAWGGTEMPCADPAPEWAVQNLEVTFQPGVTVSVPVTVQTGTTGDVWMRVSLSERPLDPPGGDWDGSAPAPGWLFGETEDYLICVGAGDEDCADALDQLIFADGFEAAGLAN